MEKRRRNNPIEAGEHPAVKQLCRKGVGGPCGQVEHESAMCPCHKKS